MASRRNTLISSTAALALAGCATTFSSEVSRFSAPAVAEARGSFTIAPADPQRYAMRHVVADTLAVMDRLAIERFALLGYSMGGRMALTSELAEGTRGRVSPMP